MSDNTETSADVDTPILVENKQGDDVPLDNEDQKDELEELDPENMEELLEQLDQAKDLGDINAIEEESKGEQGEELELEENKALDDSVLQFLEHTDSIYCFASSGNIVLSGDGADKAIVWDMKTGEVKAQLADHKDSVIACGFNYNNKLFATAGMDGVVKVYKTSNPTKVYRTLDGPDSEIIWMRWHTRSNYLAAGSGDGNVWMWDGGKGDVFNVFAGHSDAVSCGSFSHDGKELYTGSEDGTVIVWSVTNATAKHILRPQSTQNMSEAPITTLAVHPRARTLLTGSVDSTACLINATSGKVIYKLTAHEEGIETVGFCQTQHQFFSTCDLKNALKIWDTTTGQCRVTCTHRNGIVKSVWHPTEPRVFTACLDHLIHAWDARTGELLMVWSGHKDTILDLQLSDDAQFLLSGSDDFTVRVYSTTTLTEQQEKARQEVIKAEDERIAREEAAKEPNHQMMKM